MKVYRNIMIACVIFLATLIIVVCTFYNYQLSPIGKDDSPVVVKIEQGMSTADIIRILKEKELIRNEFVIKFYVKANKVNNLKAGTYELKKSMTVKEIMEVLEKGNGFNENQISITFREGLTMRGIARVIAEKTTNTYESVFELLKEKEYLATLKARYPFLKETIERTEIYYPLEGYLFPETYYFESKDVSVKTIFETMLNQTEKILSKYETELQKNKRNLHELMTLASIVQSEGTNFDNMATIASVFYNRLNIGDDLGSCVTSYYGVKIDMGERNLYNEEFTASNPYNTRAPGMKGKLPVGPISNPGEAAIKAVLLPEETDYYFFVSDKNRKLYFTTTYSEHVAMVQKLQNEGLWLNW